MGRSDRAEVEEAVKVIVEIAARYAERHRAGSRYAKKDHVRPAGPVAEWIDNEEAALFEIVRTILKFDDTIAVGTYRGTKITRRDLWLAGFARDLYEIVRKKPRLKSTAETGEISDLLDLHKMKISLDAFAALRAALTPAEVRAVGGAMKAVRKATAQMIGRDGEARGPMTIANAQAFFREKTSAALQRPRWSKEKTLVYLSTILD